MYIFNIIIKLECDNKVLAWPVRPGRCMRCNSTRYSNIYIYIYYNINIYNFNYNIYEYSNI